MILLEFAILSVERTRTLFTFIEDPAGMVGSAYIFDSIASFNPRLYFSTRAMLSYLVRTAYFGESEVLFVHGVTCDFLV